MAKNKIAINSTNNESNATNSTNANLNNNNGVKVKRKRKSVPRESPSQRSSIYRGVTRHRWTGRYEAHLWDKNCWNESQNKKGRQVYLGAYDDEEAAAHAYDLAALKYWGHETILNFPLNTYQEELNEMDGQSKEEYIGSLRRKSSGFSRGVSKYRGVARHHHNGRWEARIGRVFGNKYLYLGTYATQEEAATAYDMAAIEYRGLNAVTNFDLSRYIKWLRPNSDNSQNNIQTNNTLVGNSSVTNIVHEHDSNNNNNNNNNNQAQQKQENTADISSSSTITHSGSGSGSATSALSLLFQSPKFKEMLEQSSAVSHSCDSMPESENKVSKCSFPDDIQTYFGCHDAVTYAEGDDAIFGDFSTFASPVIQFEFDG